MKAFIRHLQDKKSLTFQIFIIFGGKTTCESWGMRAEQEQAKII
jgi:hypothetical protein